MQTACENGEYRQRDLMKEFSVSVIFINSWKLNSILQECHSELNISNKKNLAYFDASDNYLSDCNITEDSGTGVDIAAQLPALKTFDFSGNFCSTKKIPYREIFVNKKRKLVIHCKTFVKNSVAAFLVTKPRIHQQIPTIRSAGGQAVTALVSGMTVMALSQKNGKSEAKRS